MQRHTILLVEDGHSRPSIYRGFLRDSGYDLTTAGSADEALAAVARRRPAVACIDLDLGDGGAMPLLAQLAELKDAPDIVVMTAPGESEMAVRAVSLGAVDFLTKPFDAARLRVTLDNILAQQALRESVATLARRHGAASEHFVGSSPAMLSLYQSIDAIAASEAAVLIIGEGGTGKERAAFAIHEHSIRRDAPFVAFSCAGLSQENMEREFFSEGGAAAEARGGSLYLDEVCELSATQQKILLRFLRQGGSDEGSGTVQGNVRLLCATHADPLRAVQNGELLEDLYYRLSVLPLRLPPLRERGGDIALLAAHFLAEYASHAGKRFRGFSRSAVEVLQRYPWPGNVRQLQNVIREIVTLQDGGQVVEEMLPEQLRSGHLVSIGPAAVTATAPRERVEPLWAVEKRAIEEAIDACDGNVNRAAGLLEVAPSTLYRKLQSWKQGRQRRRG
jgi:two-component system repressor protein LuxO